MSPQENFSQAKSGVSESIIERVNMRFKQLWVCCNKRNRRGWLHLFANRAFFIAGNREIQRLLRIVHIQCDTHGFSICPEWVGLMSWHFQFQSRTRLLSSGTFLHRIVHSAPVAYLQTMMRRKISIIQCHVPFFRSDMVSHVTKFPFLHACDLCYKYHVPLRSRIGENATTKLIVLTRNDWSVDSQLSSKSLRETLFIVEYESQFGYCSRSIITPAQQDNSHASSQRNRKA